MGCLWRFHAPSRGEGRALPVLKTGERVRARLGVVRMLIAQSPAARPLRAMMPLGRNWMKMMMKTII